MKKSVKILIASVALLGVCAFTGATNQNYIGVRAEGEESSEPVVVEEQPTEQEEVSIKDEITKFKDTFLIPLLSGVSLSSIGAFIWIIVSNKIERVSREKKTKAEEEKRSAEYKRIEERYQQTEEMLAKAQQLIAIAFEIKEAVLSSEKTSEQTLEYVQAKLVQFETKVKEIAGYTSKTDKIAKAIQLIGQIQVKLAKQSQNVIKSGLISDINEISQLLKEID